MEKHTCPVCGFDGLDAAPYNEDGQGSFEICPCCGFEYGFDDYSEGVTHADYRERWMAGGREWFDGDQKPDGWDLRAQLKNIGERRDDASE